MKIKIILPVTLIFFLAAGSVYAFWGSKYESLTPEGGAVRIPLSEVSDGKAHYFKSEVPGGKEVMFFVLKSSDGVMRAAVDACDVCYRAGKGYVQEGDMMVCENCGMKFASRRINLVKGGCNPAPLEREVRGKDLVITMDELSRNSWYCEYK